MNRGVNPRGSFYAVSLRIEISISLYGSSANVISIRRTRCISSAEFAATARRIVLLLNFVAGGRLKKEGPTKEESPSTFVSVRRDTKEILV